MILNTSKCHYKYIGIVVDDNDTLHISGQY